VQRVDLGAALVRLLVEHPSRQHQDAPKDKLTSKSVRPSILRAMSRMTRPR
jgi:hypothetical protein